MSATLEENWKIITALVNYGEGYLDEPPAVPGLLPTGRVLLARKESRRHAKTWAGNCEGLMEDLRKYYARQHPDRETGDKLQADTAAALTGFAERMNLLASNL